MISAKNEELLFEFEKCSGKYEREFLKTEILKRMDRRYTKMI